MDSSQVKSELKIYRQTFHPSLLFIPFFLHNPFSHLHHLPSILPFLQPPFFIPTFWNQSASCDRRNKIEMDRDRDRVGDRDKQVQKRNNQQVSISIDNYDVHSFLFYLPAFFLFCLLPCQFEKFSFVILYDKEIKIEQEQTTKSFNIELGSNNKLEMN